MGSPSIYVYDCSNAGVIVETFKQFAIQHESEYEVRMLNKINYQLKNKCTFQFISLLTYFCLTGNVTTAETW